MDGRFERQTCPLGQRFDPGGGTGSRRARCVDGQCDGGEGEEYSKIVAPSIGGANWGGGGGSGDSAKCKVHKAKKQIFKDHFFYFLWIFKIKRYNKNKLQNKIKIFFSIFSRHFAIFSKINKKYILKL
jgi:hypothetical protein